MGSPTPSDSKPQCTATASSTGERCKNKCVDGRYCASHVEVSDELRCQAECSSRKGRCTRATMAGADFCRQHSPDSNQGDAPPSSSSASKQSDKVTCGAPTKAGHPCKLTAGPSGRCKRHAPSTNIKPEEGEAEGSEREVYEIDGSSDSEGEGEDGPADPGVEGEGRGGPPASGSSKCGAITKKGTPCKNSAAPGSRCKVHAGDAQGAEENENPVKEEEVPRCSATTKAGLPCKLPPGPCGRCGRHREGPPPAAGAPPGGDGEEGSAEGPGLCGAATKSGKPCRRKVSGKSPNGRCSAHQPAEGEAQQSAESDTESDY